MARADDRVDIALVTCAALPGLAPDDRILLSALSRQGVRAAPIVWEDRYTDWPGVGAAIVRSVWDYAYRADAFLQWAETAARSTRVWNPPNMIRWNLHKSYLRDLAAAGVPVLPTVHVPRGSARSLTEIMRDQDWIEAVVKPAVGSSGRRVQRVDSSSLARLTPLYDRMLQAEDMLVQPYVPSIVQGELSIVWVAGSFTHAVRKLPGNGDYRVQDDFGGTVDLVEPTLEEMTAASAAIRYLSDDPLFGRVDLVHDACGEPTVQELELIEPELFLRHSKIATNRLATRIAAMT